LQNWKGLKNKELRSRPGRDKKKAEEERIRMENTFEQKPSP
jgi:hypothetical protein